MPDKNYILTREAAAQKMQRMALEIAEQLSGDETPLIIIGVRGSGMVIAEKTGALLKNLVPNPVQIIAVNLDKTNPDVVTLSEAVSVDKNHVLITDDVTNSGRTLLYALKPLLAFRPRSIQMLVLVERMHKLFPVKPDFVGLSIATTLQEHIKVEVEGGEVVGAFVE